MDKECGNGIPNAVAGAAAGVMPRTFCTLLTQNARNQSYIIANVVVTYSYIIIIVSARRQRADRCARHAHHLTQSYMAIHLK